MPDIQEKPARLKRRRKATINYPLAATLIAQHVTFEDAAAQCGAKNGNVLKVGLAKRGVTARLARNGTEQTLNRALLIATRLTTKASEQLKGKVSTFLENHVDKLLEVPAMADIQYLKSVGEAAEPFARIAKVVHGWGDTSALAVIQSGQMPEPDDCGVAATSPSGAIEVNSEVIPQEDKPQ